MRFPPIFLAFTLALAGCASTPHAPESRLTGLIELPVESSQTIRLAAPLRYTAPAAESVGSKDQQFYLVAGTYRPYKYNEAGTFYLGEQPAVVERRLSGPAEASTLLRIGGIWIPADPAMAPKLFIVSDYYKPLADGAPIPEKMSVANLADFRREPVAHTQPGRFMYIPASLPAAVRTITPLQAGLAGAAITGVMILLNRPEASRELVFAGGEIADPEAVRQVRTAFPSAWR